MKEQKTFHFKKIPKVDVKWYIHFQETLKFNEANKRYFNFNMEIQLLKNNHDYVCRTCLKLFEQSQLHSFANILNKSLAQEKSLELNNDFISFLFEKLLVRLLYFNI